MGEERRGARRGPAGSLGGQPCGGGGRRRDAVRALCGAAAGSACPCLGTVPVSPQGERGLRGGREAAGRSRLRARSAGAAPRPLTRVGRGHWRARGVPRSASASRPAPVRPGLPRCPARQCERSVPLFSTRTGLLSSWSPAFP